MDKKDSYSLRGANKSNGIDIEESRMRRHEDTIALRKPRNDEIMLMRRNSGDSNEHVALPQVFIGDVLDAINSTDEERLIQGLRSASIMLYREHNPPSDLIAPICIRLLVSASTKSSLQVEAAWTLISVANGFSDQTHCIIKHNAVPHFVALLQAKNIILANEAVQALAKIAANGATARDCVLQCNVIDGILPLFNTVLPLPMLRNIVWLISNLCRNKNPSPPFEQVRHLLPVLSKLLHNQDIQVLADAGWALSYLTNCDDREVIQAVIDAKIVPGLVKLLQMDEPIVNEPALRSVGNIVTGTDQAADAFIDSGGLSCLGDLLMHHKSYIVEEAAWTVSNITTTGNRRHIQAIIVAGLFEPLRHVLETGDFKAQREAAWAVTNTLTLGSPTQIFDMIGRYKILKPYINLLEAWDSPTIKVVLAGLCQLFSLAEKLGGIASLCQKFEQMGGLQKLEILQQHMQGVVQEKASAILDTYFSATDQDKDESQLAPQKGEGDLEFKFTEPKDNGGYNF